MSFDDARLPHVVADFFGSLPHPDIPEIKVSEYEAFARVAARFYENAKPVPEQVQHAFHMLNNAGLSPAQFERAWDVAKPLANRLLGRPPSIHDLHYLADAHPADIQDYYLSHPHPDYPEVAAGEIARYHEAAKPFSREFWNRDPVISEVARFAIAGYDGEDLHAHYQKGSEKSGA